MRKFTLLFAVLLSLVGVNTKAETLTETFNDVTVTSRYLLSNGWVMVHSNGNYQGFGGSYDYQIKSGNYDGESGNSLSCDYSDNNEYVVIPTKLTGTFSYYVKRSSSSNGTVTFFEATKDGDIFTVTSTQLATTSTNSSWASKSFDLGSEGKYVAIRLLKSRIDQISATIYEEASGPVLAVKDGSTKISSPYAYNFGLATAGTTKTFTLSNPGTADLGVEVSETGNFGATLSATTIPAGGEETLTVTMPATTGSSTITITPTTSDIDPFVINVSGTIRDANKSYLDFADGNMPDGWTSVQTGSYGSAWSASEGYVSQSGGSSSYAWALTSPQMTFAKDELIAFETAKYSSSSWYTPSITVEYSLDGSTWTAIGSAFTDDVYGTWTPRSVTIPVEGVKYIRFNGWYVHLRNIYGGEELNEPRMVVTQPASLDFGLITEATAKTFTIANTGKATLEGITVTSSNNSIFAISNAPTSLAAGASQEVTITMAASTAGALNSNITVSATDMENVEFTVSGVVLPDGLYTETFADGLPTNWVNASWTFANGEATGKSSSAYLTTPKLIFNAGDMVVIKAKRYDNDATDYLTVQGSSDNGATWTAYSKKLQNADGLTYPDYGTIVLTDIPTTVNKLRFVGYYVVVDEIAGLTYAPVLTVTKGGEAVATGSTYDFEESAADADVTYNFANSGAGTINITNVTVTGDGAAAYSTNWTESVATPFDLVITRTYDAERESASVAVVTVTTTDGTFVINVTGTDKAANAPELSVTPDEAAAFGAVTEAAAKVYTVTNAGTGTLTVNIASDDEMFTVSPAQLTDIAAGDSKTFTVTFTPVAETYGVFDANITVTPTYDEEAAKVIAATAQVKDPNVWSEDFSGNTQPTGWNAGANWSFTNGVAKAAYAYGSTTYLTTPALTVTDASDEMTFDYEATANYVSIKIQMSKDGAAFADYHTISGLNNGDKDTYIITGLEAGEYQFRFANDDYQLDNFEGFKLNLADHIASITAYSIPQSSSWNVTMKEGRSFEASVTVQELRGVAEELTAKLYMGEDVIGTANGSVEANGTTVLNITATPNAAAAEGVEMHIEVEWAGETMSTEAVTRYVAALTSLTLDETSSDAVVAGSYDEVTLKRTFVMGWNTVCLPFTISDVEAFFGEGAKAYEFSGYVNGHLEFQTVSSLTASYPYVVYMPAAITEDIKLADITIASNDADPWYTRKTNSSNKGLYFRGTYAPVAAGKWTKDDDADVIYGVTSDGYIRKAGASASMKGFRAYFDLDDVTAAEVKGVAFDGEIATGLHFVNGTIEADQQVYDLNGRRLNSATQKGLYIVNGKKIMVK